MIELLIVAGSVAGSVVSERLLLPAVIIIGFTLAFRAFVLHQFNRTPADWAIAGLILMLPVTLWASALPGKSLPQIYRLLTGIGFYYALKDWGTSAKRLRSISFIIAISGLLLAIYGSINTQWILDKFPFIPSSIYSRLPQLTSDTIHPNVLAGSLVILLPVIISYPLFTWAELPAAQRLVYILSSLILGVVIFLTQARGAYLGMVCATALVFMLRWKRSWIVFITILVIAVIVLSANKDFLLNDASKIAGDSSEKLEGRLEIWSRGIYMVQDFPLTGVGMGLFGDIADRMYPFFFNAPGSVPHAHNLFLQITVDLGLPGLISWLAVFMIISFTTWQLYRQDRQEGWLAGYGAGLLGSQIALAAQGTLDAVTWGMVRPAPIVWGLWGVAAAAWTFYAGSEIKTPVE